MHSLLLVGYLSAAALAAEPVSISVEAHPLAPGNATKGIQQAPELVETAAHAMRASIDANGRIRYNCDNAVAGVDFRFDARAARRER